MPQLTSHSTLEELWLGEYQVGPDTLGSAIVSRFEQQSDLSGVLIIDQASMLMGMVSRPQLYQELGQPFAIELFLKRPIRTFLDVNPSCCNPFILSYDERIDKAVRLSLDRPPEELFEPIVVEFQHPQLPDMHSYFLLDCHTLLVAHSQILNIVNDRMQRQTKVLARERRKVKAYTKRLEAQQTEIQERNLLLEQQKQQLLSQSEEIQILNQRFIYVGKVLSREGKKAFQATFAGVNAICQNTDQIASIGKMLEVELETIDAASTLIEKVSRQVRQLSIQAAIAINKQKGYEVSGFGYIVKEIGYLINQTREAGRQMRSLADRFRERVDVFTTSARSGTSVARSLIGEIEQAAIALSALEKLVQDNEANVSGIPDDRSLVIRAQEMEQLRQKLAKAEGALANLRQTMVQ
ncbi:MAG: hypothetical protein F6K30_17635 [Cyanothece sp. SIO2G6]|nr:hypothetical protein [Cyanothece sp. SIO2G6]